MEFRYSKVEHSYSVIEHCYKKIEHSYSETQRFCFFFISVAVRQNYQNYPLTMDLIRIRPSPCNNLEPLYFNFLQFHRAADYFYRRNRFLETKRTRFEVHLQLSSFPTSIQHHYTNMCKILTSKSNDRIFKCRTRASK